jgi:hypothetical protein
MSTSRWIYGFQYTDSRELTTEEREQAKNLARRYGILRFVIGGFAALSGVVGILGIIVASHSTWWGWFVILAGLLGSGVLLAWANRAERLSLLLRRTARVGELDVFVRVGANAKVRSFYRAPFPEDDDEYIPSKPYWEAEERFEQALLKEAGPKVDGLETPKDDDAVVRVADRWVRRVHEIAVFDLEKRG